MAKIVLFLLLWSGGISTLRATALGDLAAQMNPGEWRELVTTGLGTAMNWPTFNCASTIFGYSEDAAWDPGSEQFYFLGGNHCYDTANSWDVHLTYSAQTNSWQRASSCPGEQFGGNPHGYGYTAIDPKSGTLLWYGPATSPAGYGDRSLWKFDIQSTTWTEQATSPSGNEGLMTFGGVEYLAELDRVLVVGLQYGTVVSLINPATGNVARVTGSMPMGNGSNFVEYNAVHKCIIFGGGSGSNALYKMDSAGTVTRMGDTPFGMAGNSHVLTVDPVSGDFLIFDGANGGSLHIYDVTSDKWTQQGGTKPAIFVPPYNNDATMAAYSIIAAPVKNYGVTMFVKGLSQSSGKVYLYKHSPGVAAEKSAGKLALPGLTASPNPARGLVHIGAAAGSQVKVFDLGGKRVADFSAPHSGTLVWRTGHLPRGLYLLKAGDAGSEGVRRVLLQ